MLQMYIKKGRLKKFWMLNVERGMMMLLLNVEGAITSRSFSSSCVMPKHTALALGE